MKQLNTQSSTVHRHFVTLMMFMTLSVLMLNGQQTINGTLEVDGVKREYILYVPQRYTEGAPVPLVLNFHGYFNSAQQQLAYGDFRTIADREGFLVVHPQGLGDQRGINHFNVGWGNSTVDDLGFAKALLDKIESEYTINPKRIYSTGFSNGGFMSYRLACELSARIAAVASVSGSITKGQLGTCNPVHPTPILQIHGTADTVVSYDGSQLFEPVDALLAYWVAYNKTASVPEISEIPDSTINDGSTVTYQRYENSENNIAVAHFKIENGTHTWPMAQPEANFDINASEEIWKFFSQYDLDGRIETLSTNINNELEKNIVTLYPNPTTEQLVVDFVFASDIWYHIVTPNGRVVNKGILTTTNNTIDVSTLAKGMYLLHTEGYSFKFIKN